MQFVDIDSLSIIGRHGIFDGGNLIMKIVLSTMPIIYSLTYWLGSEVYPALIVGNQRENHAIGTTMSLILSFIYVVEPSILMASSYYIWRKWLKTLDLLTNNIWNEWFRFSGLPSKSIINFQTNRIRISKRTRGENSISNLKSVHKLLNEQRFRIPQPPLITLVIFIK